MSLLQQEMMGWKKLALQLLAEREENARASAN